ncbi:TIGR04104 family putative zinc finger protein [Alkalihalobacillus sp. R86527]|uniref:TIGR04104 family putative zinc finger protein n=1 Tax=Alkalihalobacillus sp. R86527 TaxID=3093863 RepID=UPI003671544D
MVSFKRKDVRPIPTCQHCSSTWSWHDTLKSQPLLFGSGLTCSYCGKSQYLTTKAQGRQVLLSLVITFSIIAFIEHSAASTLLTFISFIIGVAGLILLTPFVMEVSNKRTLL